MSDHNPMIDGYELAGCIASFCARVGMAEKHFGTLCLNDATFMDSLRKGRRVRLTTFNRVKAFIERRDRRYKLGPKLIGPAHRAETEGEKRASFNEEKMLAQDAERGSARLAFAVNEYILKVAAWNHIEPDEARSALLGREPARKSLPTTLPRPANHDFTLAGVSAGMLAA